MAQNQYSKDEQSNHTTASPSDALHLVRRRPVARPPKCGRDALAGYAVGATIGSTLALAYFFTARAFGL